MIVERNLIPGAHVERIQVIDGGERIELVQGRSYPMVFDIRQSADVEDKLGSSAM